MASKTDRPAAGRVEEPVAGSTRSYIPSRPTASIKDSVMPTEILKFVISEVLFLQVMKSIISGWSTRRMPIFAPRRVPPCLTASVAALKTFIKDTGPLATPAGGIHRRALGPQPGKGEAGAAAGLMDEGGVFDGIENVLHGVCHRQYETGGQLSQRTARIHQRRGIGQEIQLGHHPVKRTGGGRHIGLGIEDGVGCGDRIGDPVEQAVHRFNRLAASFRAR